jgi:replication factor C large subunit
MELEIGKSMSDDWTELYRPKSLKEVIGNSKAVKELKDWAVSWEAGIPPKRVAVLIGPPGVGKTSSALALANDFGWGVIEMNASDQRNGEAIRRIALRGALTDTFTSEGEYLSHRQGRKKLIIMDEADNIFGREDHGGVPAIVELIVKTKHPVILIVNDFYGLSRKSSAIKEKTLQIKFTRIPSPTIRTLLRKVAADQEISASDGVLDIIAKNSNGDLRAALRDLQAIGLGNVELKEEQAMALDNRMSSRTMYDLMGEIFQGTAPRVAQMHMWDMQETPEFVLLWVDENLPIAYRDSEDLWRGYQLLARADVMLGRVKRRQYFGYWSYASDLISFGMCAAKGRPYRGFIRYQFPGYLLKMGRSKSMRGAKQSLGLKLGSVCHTSSNTAIMDIMPYVRQLFKKDQEFRLAAMSIFGLDEEDAAFLLEEKIDSSAVKHLLQALQRKRSGEAEEHDLRPTKIEEAAEKAAKEDKAPDESLKQRSLFEY